MNMLNITLTILFLGLALTSCGQTKESVEQSVDFKALARLISFEGGDKIHFAKFKIIRDLSDTLTLNDIVFVGFYNYKPPETNLNTVLLTLKKYGGKTSIKNYFICPDYDGKQGIQSAKIDFIDFAYWEACETGKGDCHPLTFTRPKAERNWYLMMPCGGTETAISIAGQNFNKKLHLHHDNCPPCLDLTNLNDGQYFATMNACGLGGTVQFNLTTNTETFRSRTGDEIYDALFDKRQTNCIKILNYQDQVVPKIDYAIWLQFETCPEELKRILSRHEFTAGKVSTDKWDGKIPYGEKIKWFNPKTLGDTIMVYEYSTDDSRKIQTIWTNLDSTKVFVRDIFD